MVWCGTHPDETLALQVGEDLISDPLAGIDTDIVNKPAFEQGQRMLDNRNMMQFYPGSPSATDYESRRAAEIVERNKKYDTVIDLHNLRQYGETTAILSAKRGVTPAVLGFLSKLGARNLIIDETLGMHPHSSNAFALELAWSLSPETVRTSLDVLANEPQKLQGDAGQFSWFRFVGDLHMNDVNFNDYQKAIGQLAAFEPLPTTLDQQIKLRYAAFADMSLCPIAWSDVPNPYGYLGELVTPIPRPDTHHWPK